MVPTLVLLVGLAPLLRAAGWPENHCVAVIVFIGLLAIDPVGWFIAPFLAMVMFLAARKAAGQTGHP